MSETTHLTRQEFTHEQGIRPREAVLDSASLGTPTPARPPDGQRSGPNTTKGKATSALNATRGGVFAKAPIIPGLERLEDWEAHVTGVLESLQPIDYLDFLDAQQVAYVTWRQKRLRQAEVGALGLLQNRVDEEVARRLTERAEHLHMRGYFQCPDENDLAREIQRSQTRLAQLARLADERDKTSFPRHEAARLLNSLIADTEIPRTDLPPKLRKRLDPTHDPTPAATVRKAAKALAEADNMTLAELLRRASETQTQRVAPFLALQAWAARERSCLKALYLVAEPERLQLFMRYEAHLARQEFQHRHESEARQGRSRGEVTPLARLEIHGGPEDEGTAPPATAAGAAIRKGLARMTAGGVKASTKTPPA